MHPDKQLLTVGGLMIGFDTENGIRSTEIGLTRMPLGDYPAFERAMSDAVLSLNDVDWSKFGQPRQVDNLPVAVELRIVTQNEEGFSHQVTLNYVIHGTQKWQIFTQAVLQITGKLGFIRDSKR